MTVQDDKDLFLTMLPSEIWMILTDVKYGFCEENGICAAEKAHRKKGTAGRLRAFFGC